MKLIWISSEQLNFVFTCTRIMTPHFISIFKIKFYSHTRSAPCFAKQLFHHCFSDATSNSVAKNGYFLSLKKSNKCTKYLVNHTHCAKMIIY